MGIININKTVSSLLELAFFFLVGQVKLNKY